MDDLTQVAVEIPDTDTDLGVNPEEESIEEPQKIKLGNEEFTPEQLAADRARLAAYEQDRNIQAYWQQEQQRRQYEAEQARIQAEQQRQWEIQEQARLHQLELEEEKLVKKFATAKDGTQAAEALAEFLKTSRSRMEQFRQEARQEGIEAAKRTIGTVLQEADNYNKQQAQWEAAEREQFRSAKDTEDVRDLEDRAIQLRRQGLQPAQVLTLLRAERMVAGQKQPAPTYGDNPRNLRVAEPMAAPVDTHSSKKEDKELEAFGRAMARRLRGV